MTASAGRCVRAWLGVAMATAWGAGAVVGQDSGAIVGWGRQIILPPSVLSDVIQVSSNGPNSLALRADGSIVAWGAGGVASVVPEPNTDFVDIAAGWHHGMGLKADGSIIAWGYNDYGVCEVPEPNAGFVAVAAGIRHSLGLKADGTIAAWGSNQEGQCDVPSPNEGFKAVAASCGEGLEDGGISFAIRADGSIVAWGACRNDMCNVPAPNVDFLAISVGESHCLGLKANGSIVAWGSNHQGQCDVPAPNTDFIGVAAGSGDGVHHSLGLKADGSIVAWGANYHGQCDVPEPNTDFIGVAAGGYRSVGLKADGSVLGWGCGEISSPCDVPSPNSTFIAVSGVKDRYDRSAILGLKLGGSILRWGALGYPDVPASNTGFAAIAAGDEQYLALRLNGTVAQWRHLDPWNIIPPPLTGDGFVQIGTAWGSNYGLTKEGSIRALGSAIFVPHAINRGVVAFSVNQHLLALKNDGAIMALGLNTHGQCNVPEPNSEYVAVAAGRYHSLGLKHDGSVVTWGSNSSSQCNVPEPNTSFVAIAAGLNHSLGLKADGSIVAWGRNSIGQCNVPEPNTGFVWIDADGDQSVAIRAIEPPVAPETLAPQPGATGVAVSPVLHWADGGWGMTFDVHFGTTEPPPLVGTTAGRHWVLPVLDYGTTYYWQIVAHNPNGSTPGPVWSFQTVGDKPGDANCDGLVNFADISPFIEMIKADGPDGWPGPCPYLNGDANGDGVVDLGDISNFIALLKAGGP